jgi:hypothetical protein
LELRKSTGQRDFPDNPPQRNSTLNTALESPSRASASAITAEEKAVKQSYIAAENPSDDSKQIEVTASPQEAGELISNPGGLYGPKEPFRTPSVRDHFGTEVGLSRPKKNVHFEPHPSQTQLASRASKMSAAVNSSDVSSAAEDHCDKSHSGAINDAGSFQRSTMSTPPKPSSRIVMHRADRGEIPDQFPDQFPAVFNRDLSPGKGAPWQDEKKRRMLEWVESSQLSGLAETEQPFEKVGAFFSGSYVEPRYRYEDFKRIAAFIFLF